MPGSKQLNEFQFQYTIFIVDLVNKFQPVNLILQFNLVCDRSIYDELVFTVYSVGNLIGAFGGGTVSDRLISVFWATME